MTSVINRFKDYFIDKNETPIDFNSEFEDIKYFYIKKGFKKKIVYEFLSEIDGWVDDDTSQKYKFYKIDDITKLRFSHSDTHTFKDVMIKDNGHTNHTASVLLDNKYYKMYYVPQANISVDENENPSIPLLEPKKVFIVENADDKDFHPRFKSHMIPHAEPVVYDFRSRSSSRSSNRSGGKKTRKNKKNKNKTQKKHK